MQFPLLTGKFFSFICFLHLFFKFLSYSFVFARTPMVMVGIILLMFYNGLLAVHAMKKVLELFTFFTLFEVHAMTSVDGLEIKAIHDISWN